MPAPKNDPSDYFERHPVRIVSALNPLGVEIWNREMGIVPGTLKPSADENDSKVVEDGGLE